MRLNEYQGKAIEFARFESLDYPFTALAEEAGEVLGKLAKAQRKWGMCMETVLENVCCQDGRLNPNELKLKDDLLKELGDVLWQVQACAHNLGFNLEDVAQKNLDKLSDRDARGVICGDGDNR